MNTSDTNPTRTHRKANALDMLRGIPREARFLAIKNIYKNIISAPE